MSKHSKDKKTRFTKSFTVIDDFGDRFLCARKDGELFVMDKNASELCDNDVEYNLQKYGSDIKQIHRQAEGWILNMINNQKLRSFAEKTIIICRSYEIKDILKNIDELSEKFCDMNIYFLYGLHFSIVRHYEALNALCNFNFSDFKDYDMASTIALSAIEASENQLTSFIPQFDSNFALEMNNSNGIDVIEQAIAILDKHYGNCPRKQAA